MNSIEGAFVQLINYNSKISNINLSDRKEISWTWWKITIQNYNSLCELAKIFSVFLSVFNGNLININSCHLRQYSILHFICSHMRYRKFINPKFVMCDFIQVHNIFYENIFIKMLNTKWTNKKINLLKMSKCYQYWLYMDKNKTNSKLS